MSFRRAEHHDPPIITLAACLTIPVDADRLACTDRAAARLIAAERARDVIIVSRDEVERTRRSLFGLSLDQNNVFGERDAPAAERLDALTTAFAATSPGANGRWVLLLTEGGRWQTTESWAMPIPSPAWRPTSTAPRSAAMCCAPKANAWRG